MALALNDIVQVTYRGTFQENRIMLVTAWRVGVAPSSGTTAENLDRVCAAFQTGGAGTPLTTYLACVGDDVEFDEVRAQRVSPVRSPYVQRALSVNGAAGSEAATGNVAAVVSRITLGTGPSQVSNSHIGPLGKDDYDNGLVNVGFLTRAVAFAVRWVQTVTDVTSGIVLQPGIWHTQNAPGSDFDPVVDQRLWDTVRTMHRRTLRLGE